MAFYVRGLDINSPLSTETHAHDLRLNRHQQHDNPNNARGLDNNFASELAAVLWQQPAVSTSIRCIDLDRGVDHAAPDKS
jgi:hypothetical protein